MLRLEWHMCSTVKRLRQATHEYAPLPLHATRGTPHGASRLVQAMPACLVKARRAPSRYCRMRGSYHDGHTTTVMLKMSTPPPHLLPLTPFRLARRHGPPSRSLSEQRENLPHEERHERQGRGQSEVTVQIRLRHPPPPPKRPRPELQQEDAAQKEARHEEERVNSEEPSRENLRGQPEDDRI